MDNIEKKDIFQNSFCIKMLTTGQRVITRDAKANLKNGNIEKITCKPVWNFVTVFEKKFFFVNFHEISRYRKILKRDFRLYGNAIRQILIAQMKEEKICYKKMKNF